jgi:UDP-2,3-diacylglucosamine pyrophosphatase LpxH
VGKKELVLNGDIFDFDSAMDRPRNKKIKLSWLEKARGMESEESKSTHKINVILQDHWRFCEALSEFVKNGNTLIFIIGNHDLELHWPNVQAAVRAALKLSEEEQKRVRFCNWFYISGKDTLIEHGNQYDAYCMCQDPIHPFVKRQKTLQVRLPFGNLAGKYMLNGMGLFNPHVESSFIMSFSKYIEFFTKYIMRVQPRFVLKRLWGGVWSFLITVEMGFRPAVRDPLVLEERIDSIAKNSNATPGMVAALEKLSVHPAVLMPWMLLRELWLDRLLLFVAAFLVSFQLVSWLNLISAVPLWWVFWPLMVCLSGFIFYAKSVTSDLKRIQRAGFKRLPTSAKIAKVKRVVQGHTHKEMHIDFGSIEILNTGTWSTAYHDVECTQPYGKKVFALLAPTQFENTEPRVATLMEWLDPGTQSFPRGHRKKME